MRPYLVTFHVPNDEEHYTGYFRCEAEDAEHAIEQCKTAYPDRTVDEVRVWL